MLIKRSFILVPILAVTLFLAPSPQAAEANDGAGVANAIVDYVPNLIHDVFDIFSVGIGVGDGYALDLHATHLLDAGVSSGSGKYYGIGGRGILIGGEEFESDHAGLTVLGLTAGDNPHDNHSIGASIGCFAGIGIDINLASALDALAGLIFIDTEGDNGSLGLFGGGDSE